MSRCRTISPEIVHNLNSFSGNDLKILDKKRRVIHLV